MPLDAKSYLKIGAVGSIVLVGSGAAVTAASAVFAAQLGTLDRFHDWSLVTQWPRYYFAHHTGWTAWQIATTQHALRMGAGIGALPFGASIVLAALAVKRWWFTPGVKPLARAGTDTYGHSDWATPAEARARFSGRDRAFGCLVVAENRRRDLEPVARVTYDPRDSGTWGQGGKAPLLTDDCRIRSTHSICFAGSGVGKSQSLLCTLAHPQYRWLGSYVTGDPKRELARETRRIREAMGHRVFELRPGGPDGINIFDNIRPDSGTFETDIQALTGRMFVEQHHGHSAGDNGKWDRWGKMLVNALIAHLLTDPAFPPEDRTPRCLRAAVSMSEADLRDVLTAIAAESPSRFAREQARSVTVEAKDTFSGIYVNAQDGTGWLSNSAFADLVSGSSFRPQELAQGDMTVFVQVEPKAMKETPAIARCLYGAMMDAVYDADGKVVGRVLYDIDEAYQLGRMGILETIRDLGRSYGMTLRLWYQSVGQLEGLYGREGKQAWYSSAAYRMYAGISDEVTAKEVVGQLGGFTAQVTNTSRNQSRSAGGGFFGNGTRGRSESNNEARRELSSPAELIQDWADDECVIISRGMRPIRAGLPLAYRRPEMRTELARHAPAPMVGAA